MKTTFKIIFSNLLLLAAFSFQCGGTKEIEYREDITAFQGGRTLILYMADSSLYILNRYQLIDSLLTGSGGVEKGGVMNQFTGSIALKDVLYAEFEHSKFLHSALLTASAITVGALAIVHFASPEERFTADAATAYYRPGSGGGGGWGSGSCPFIYSFGDGKRRLEGEAFGIALGKSREMRTYTPLSGAKNDNSRVRIRLTNERPETHFFNQVELYSALIPEGAELVYDNGNSPLVIEKILSPVCATAGSDNITPELSARDKVYWASSLRPSEKNSFEDEIELTFRRPEDAREGVLVISAINTHLSNVVFKQLFAFLGNQVLPFYHAVDTDPEMKKILDDWTKETALKVSVLRNGEWISCGALNPEANEVSFTKAIRVPVSGCGDIVRVRVCALADVWKIDRAGMDWNPLKQAKTEKMEMLSAVNDRGRHCENAITADDCAYEVFYPSQWMDVGFRGADEQRGMRRVYIAAVKGHLYEWDPNKNAGGEIASFASIMPVGSKVDFVKNLLRHKDVFLPPVYAEWKAQKQNMRGPLEEQNDSR